jgi:hypothetical protein
LPFAKITMSYRSKLGISPCMRAPLVDPTET